MRWDIRHPEKRFGDRFVLVGGHTIPLIYCTLAVLNEALRIKYAQTGDSRYLVPGGAERALLWEDLLGFRRRGGLSGHAEMEGKTLFLKFNTGPSGHGGPAAAGEALALKRAGAAGVKVFAFEGEGGLTPGGVARDDELGLGPGARQPLLPGRLERLRHRRPPGQRGRATARRPTGSAATAGASSAPSRAATGRR